MPEKKGTFYGFGSYFGGGGGGSSNANGSSSNVNDDMINKKKNNADAKSPKKSPKKSPSENKNLFHGFGGTFPQKPQQQQPPPRQQTFPSSGPTSTSQPPPPKGHNNKPAYSTANVAPTNTTNHHTNPDSFAARWTNTPRGKDPAPDRGLLPARRVDRPPPPPPPSGQPSRAIDAQQKAPGLTLGNMARERVGPQSASADGPPNRGGLFNWGKPKEPGELPATARGPLGPNDKGKAPDTRFAPPSGREALSQAKDAKLQREPQHDADTSGTSFASRWRQGKGEGNDRNAMRDVPTSSGSKAGLLGSQDRPKDKMLPGVHPPPPPRKQDQFSSSTQSESSRADTSLRDGSRPKLNEPAANQSNRLDATAFNPLKSRSGRIEDESQQSKDRGRLFDRIRNGGAPNAADGSAQQVQRAGEPSRRDQPAGKKDKALDDSQKNHLRSLSSIVHDRAERQDRKLGKDAVPPPRPSREDQQFMLATSSRASPIPPIRPSPEPTSVPSQKSGSSSGGAFWRKKGSEELDQTKSSRPPHVEAQDAAKNQVPLAPSASTTSKPKEFIPGRSLPFDAQSSRAPKQAQALVPPHSERGTTEPSKLKLTAFALSKPEENGKTSESSGKSKLDAMDYTRAREPRSNGQPADQKLKPYDTAPLAGTPKSEAKEEKTVPSSAKALPSRSPLDLLGRRDKKDHADPSKLFEVPQPSDVKKDARQPAVPDALGKQKLPDSRKNAPLDQQLRETKVQPQELLQGQTVPKHAPSSGTRSSARDHPASTRAPEVSNKTERPLPNVQQLFSRKNTQDGLSESNSSRQQPPEAPIERDVPDVSAPSKAGKREILQDQDGTQRTKVDAHRAGTDTDDKKHGLRDRLAPLRGRDDKTPWKIASQPASVPEKSNTDSFRRDTEPPDLPQLSTPNVKSDRLGPSESSKWSDDSRDKKQGYLESLPGADRAAASTTNREADKRRYEDQIRGRDHPLRPSQNIPAAEPTTLSRPRGMDTATMSSQAREGKPSPHNTPLKQVFLPGRSGKEIADAIPSSLSANEQSKDSHAAVRSDMDKNDLATSLPPTKATTSQPRDLQSSFAPSRNNNRLPEGQNKPKKLRDLLKREGRESDNSRAYPVNTDDVNGPFASEHGKVPNRLAVAGNTKSDGNEGTSAMREVNAPRDAQREPLDVAGQSTTIAPRDFTAEPKPRSDSRDRRDATAVPSTYHNASTRALGKSFTKETTAVPPLDAARVPQVGASGEAFNNSKDAKDKKPFFGSRNFGEDNHTVPVVQDVGSTQVSQPAGPAFADPEIRSDRSSKKRQPEPNFPRQDQSRRHDEPQAAANGNETQQKGVSTLASRFGMPKYKNDEKQGEIGQQPKPFGAKYDINQEDLQYMAPRPSRQGFDSRNGRFDTGERSASSQLKPISDKAADSTIPPPAPAQKSIFGTAVEESEWPRPSGSRSTARDMTRHDKKQRDAPALAGEIKPVPSEPNVEEGKPRPVPEDWLMGPGVTTSITADPPLQQTQRKGWWKNLWGDENMDGKQIPVNSSSRAAQEKPMSDAAAHPTQQDEADSHQVGLDLRERKDSAVQGLSRLDEPGSSRSQPIQRPAPEENGRRVFQPFSGMDERGDQNNNIVSMNAFPAKGKSEQSFHEDVSKDEKGRFSPFSSRRGPKQAQLSTPPTRGKPDDDQTVPDLNKQPVSVSPQLPRAMDVNLVSVSADTTDGIGGRKGKSRNRKSSIYGLKAPILPDSHAPMPDAFLPGIYDKDQTDDNTKPSVPAEPITKDSASTTELKTNKSRYAGTDTNDAVAIPDQTLPADHGDLDLRGKKDRRDRSSPSHGNSHELGQLDRRGQRSSLPKEPQNPMASELTGFEPAKPQQDTRPSDIRAPTSQAPWAARFVPEPVSREGRILDNESWKSLPAESLSQQGLMPEPKSNLPPTPTPAEQANEPVHLSEQGRLSPLHDAEKSGSPYISQVPAPLRLKTTRAGGKDEYGEANTLPVAPVSRAVDSTSNIPAFADGERAINDETPNLALRSTSNVRDVPESETETKGKFDDWFKGKPKDASVTGHQDTLSDAVSTPPRDLEGKDGKQYHGSQRGNAPQESSFEEHVKSFWSTSNAKKNKSLALEDPAQDSWRPLPPHEVNDRAFDQDGRIETEASELVTDEAHKTSLFSKIRSKKDAKDKHHNTDRGLDLSQDEQHHDLGTSVWTPPPDAQDRALYVTASPTGFPMPPSAATGVDFRRADDKQTFENVDEPAFATTSGDTRAVDEISQHMAPVDTLLFSEKGREDDSIDASEKQGGKLRGLFGKKRQDKESAPTLQSSKSEATSRDFGTWSQDEQKDSGSRNIDSFDDGELKKSIDDVPVFGLNASEDEKRLRDPRASTDGKNDFDVTGKLPLDNRSQPFPKDREVVAAMFATEQPMSPPEQLYADNEDWDTAPLPRDGPDDKGLPRSTEPTFETGVVNDGADQRPASPSTRSKLASLFTKKPKDNADKNKQESRFTPERGFEYNGNDVPEEPLGALPDNDYALSPEPTPREDLKYSSTRYQRGTKKSEDKEFGGTWDCDVPAGEPRSGLPLSPPHEEFERFLPGTPALASDWSSQKQDNVYGDADMLKFDVSSYGFQPEETAYGNYRPEEFIRSSSPKHPEMHDRALSGAEWQYQDASQPIQQDVGFSHSPAWKDSERPQPAFDQDRASSSQFAHDFSASPHEEFNAPMGDPLSTIASPRQSESALSPRRSLDMTVHDEVHSESKMPGDDKSGLGSKLRNWLKKSDNKGEDGNKSEDLEYSSAKRGTDRAPIAEYDLVDVPHREMEQGKLHTSHILLKFFHINTHVLPPDAPLSSSRPASVLDSPSVLHEDDTFPRGNDSIESFEDNLVSGRDAVPSDKQNAAFSPVEQDTVLDSFSTYDAASPGVPSHYAGVETATGYDNKETSFESGHAASPALAGDLDNYHDEPAPARSVKPVQEYLSAGYSSGKYSNETRMGSEDSEFQDYEAPQDTTSFDSFEEPEQHGRPFSAKMKPRDVEASLEPQAESLPADKSIKTREAAFTPESAPGEPSPLDQTFDDVPTPRDESMHDHVDNPGLHSAAVPASPVSESHSTGERSIEMDLDDEPKTPADETDFGSMPLSAAKPDPADNNYEFQDVKDLDDKPENDGNFFDARALHDDAPPLTPAEDRNARDCEEERPTTSTLPAFEEEQQQDWSDPVDDDEVEMNDAAPLGSVAEERSPPQEPIMYSTGRTGGAFADDAAAPLATEDDFAGQTAEDSMPAGYDDEAPLAAAEEPPVMMMDEPLPPFSGGGGDDFPIYEPVPVQEEMMPVDEPVAAFEPEPIQEPMPMQDFTPMEEPIYGTNDSYGDSGAAQDNGWATAGVAAADDTPFSDHLEDNGGFPPADDAYMPPDEGNLAQYDAFPPQGEDPAPPADDFPAQDDGFMAQDQGNPPVVDDGFAPMDGGDPLPPADDYFDDAFDQGGPAQPAEEKFLALDQEALPPADDGFAAAQDDMDLPQVDEPMPPGEDFPALDEDPLPIDEEFQAQDAMDLPQDDGSPAQDAMDLPQNDDFQAQGDMDFPQDDGFPAQDNMDFPQTDEPMPPVDDLPILDEDPLPPQDDVFMAQDDMDLPADNMGDQFVDNGHVDGGEADAYMYGEPEPALDTAMNNSDADRGMEPDMGDPPFMDDQDFDGGERGLEDYGDPVASDDFAGEEMPPQDDFLDNGGEFGAGEGFDDAGGFDDRGFDDGAGFEDGGAFDNGGDFNDGGDFDNGAGFDDAAGFDDGGGFDKGAGFDEGPGFDDGVGVDEAVGFNEGAGFEDGDGFNEDRGLDMDENFADGDNFEDGQGFEGGENFADGENIEDGEEGEGFENGEGFEDGENFDEGQQFEEGEGFEDGENFADGENFEEGENFEGENFEEGEGFEGDRDLDLDANDMGEMDQFDDAVEAEPLAEDDFDNDGSRSMDGEFENEEMELANAPVDEDALSLAPEEDPSADDGVEVEPEDDFDNDVDGELENEEMELTDAPAEEDALSLAPEDPLPDDEAEGGDKQDRGIEDLYAADIDLDMDFSPLPSPTVYEPENRELDPLDGAGPSTPAYDALGLGITGIDPAAEQGPQLDAPEEEAEENEAPPVPVRYSGIYTHSPDWRRFSVLQFPSSPQLEPAFVEPSGHEQEEQEEHTGVPTLDPVPDSAKRWSQPDMTGELLSPQQMSSAVPSPAEEAATDWPGASDPDEGYQESRGLDHDDYFVHGHPEDYGGNNDGFVSPGSSSRSRGPQTFDEMDLTTTTSPGLLSPSAEDGPADSFGDVAAQQQYDDNNDNNAAGSYNNNNEGGMMTRNNRAFSGLSRRLSGWWGGSAAAAAASSSSSSAQPPLPPVPYDSRYGAEPSFI